MTQVIDRVGIVLVADLANQLIQDLATVMTSKFPTAIDNATKIGTFESKLSIDPLAATQPWRLRIEADAQEHLIINAGTNLQLPDDGSFSLLDNGVSRSGELGYHNHNPSGTADQNIYFINRAQYQTNQKQSYPMNYRIVATNRGLSLFIWETSMDDQAINYSWFVIQRPTNNVTGEVLKTGKCPVFSLYAIHRQAFTWPTGQNDMLLAATTDIIQRMVVREADVTRPSLSVVADSDSDDGYRSINKYQQVLITEDGRYVLSFPNGLHSKRFFYPNYELDMIAYSSADVVSESSQASFTAYGENTPRQYRAMMANNPRNTGMRVYQYTGGGESLNTVNT
jgi:hypothetical protein